MSREPPMAGAPMLNRMIELHDSEVVSIAEVGSQLVILLRAYVHQSAGRPGRDAGTGWVQAAALTLAHGEVEGDWPELPADIFNGDLLIDGRLLENEIPIPFEHLGQIVLRVELAPACSLAVRGSGAVLTLLGEPVYVEEFLGAEAD